MDVIWIPIVVSVLALGFTVVSFWWIHARPGRLRTWSPRAYASSATQDGPDSLSLHVRLPLVVHNSGAIPLVVENMRLRFRSDSPGTPSFVLVAVHRRLYGPDSEREYATAFTVPGRGEFERTFEFQRVSFPTKLEDGSDCNFRLWVKAYGERRKGGFLLLRWLPSWSDARWRALLDFELPSVIWTGGIVPRDNRADDEPGDVTFPK